MAPHPPILWRDDYSVGVVEIDTQHKRLLELLNKVNALNPDKFSPAQRNNEVMKMLEMLNEYAAYRFLSEEALMREHIEANEDTVKHVVAHRSYWSIIATFKQRFEQGDEKVNADLVEYLNRWWVSHILETDQQLGRELNRRGIH